MKLYRTLGLLGVWMIILPFLGFPSRWKAFFMILTGLLLLVVAYSRYSRSERIKKERNERTKTFSENKQADIQEAPKV